MAKGKLFVISGASGVGKSTVLKQVMEGREDLSFSVSATTRQARPGGSLIKKIKNWRKILWKTKF